MKNITITLDEATAAWVRILAAKEGKSVSRLLGELLQERMRHAREYDDSMRRFLGKKPVRLRSTGSRYATRAELHDRRGLR